jgi:putative transposase
LENASLAFEPAKALQEHKAELAELQQENDALVKKPGKTTIERDWLEKKLKSLDLSNRKSLVKSRLSPLSLTRQCAMRHISRSSYYYQPVPMSNTDLKIMHTIIEIVTDNSEYGYRYIHQ